MLTNVVQKFIFVKLDEVCKGNEYIVNAGNKINLAISNRSFLDKLNKFLVPYLIFAISRVLPMVPRMRLSCIFCTWFPVRRSEDRGHSMRKARVVVGLGKVHLVMGGYVFHVMALGK